MSVGSVCVQCVGSLELNPINPIPLINTMEDEGDGEEEEDFEGSGDFGLIAEFTRVGETNRYWKAAHREARVQIPTDDVKEEKQFKS